MAAESNTDSKKENNGRQKSIPGSFRFWRWTKTDDEREGPKLQTIWYWFSLLDGGQLGQSLCNILTTAIFLSTNTSQKNEPPNEPFICHSMHNITSMYRGCNFCSFGLEKDNWNSWCPHTETSTFEFTFRCPSKIKLTSNLFRLPQTCCCSK